MSIEKNVKYIYCAGAGFWRVLASFEVNFSLIIETAKK